MEERYALSLLGGAIIGLSVSLLLLVNGRIAGVSGIVGALFRPATGDIAWRLAFVLGLVLTGGVLSRVMPSAFGSAPEGSSWMVVAAGLLVGFGTRLGNGCTSGHGVCGLSRLSIRSLVSTLTFIVAGAITVFLVKHLFGGRI
jgi:uncharacterized protein